MVGLLIEGWYPSEEKAVMNTPLFTLAGSLLTMAFPALMLLSGKHTKFVPWLLLITALLIGTALLSTFFQRRVLILHRSVHLGVVLFFLVLVTAFMESISSWIGIFLCVCFFFTTFHLANKTSAGYGVQFRRQWDSSKYLKLSPSRYTHWKIVNAKPNNGIMAVSRTKQQLAVMYCEYDEDGCWLHLDVFSGTLFNLAGFLFEEE